MQPGEVHGFLGPNGAGKSTTLRALLGLVRVDAGTAAIFGLDPRADAVAIHRRLAYVPGDVTLWPNLSGGETVDLLLRLRGVEPGSTRRAELLERFELDPRTKVRASSKGNRQKIALVAALAADVDLLVLDEPSSGLDPLMEEVFTQCVLEHAANGTPVLLSSHILGEVERLADRVTIIRAGRTVESGGLTQLRHLRRTHVHAEVSGSLDPAAFAGAHDVLIDATGVSCTVDAQTLPVVLCYASAAAVGSLYPTVTDQVAAADALNAGPAIVALYGPILDVHSRGELAMSKATVLYAVLLAALVAVLVRRHTRADEEAGHAELLGGTALGRDAVLTAAVIEGVVVSLLVGVLAAAADVAGPALGERADLRRCGGRGAVPAARGRRRVGAVAGLALAVRLVNPAASVVGPALVGARAVRRGHRRRAAGGRRPPLPPRPRRGSAGPASRPAGRLAAAGHRPHPGSAAARRDAAHVDRGHRGRRTGARRRGAQHRWGARLGRRAAGAGPLGRRGRAAGDGGGRRAVGRGGGGHLLPPWRVRCG